MGCSLGFFGSLQLACLICVDSCAIVSIRGGIGSVPLRRWIPSNLGRLLEKLPKVIRQFVEESAVSFRIASFAGDVADENLSHTPGVFPRHRRVHLRVFLP